MGLTVEQVTKLREAFPPEQVGQLPKGGALLDYVGHGAVTDRLLSVDPEWNWEPLALDEHGLPALDAAGNLWIKLTVGGVTRLGVGDGPTMKVLIGDALRNAAMRFGVALDLWVRGHAEDDEKRAPQEGRFQPRAASERVELVRLLGEAGLATNGNEAALRERWEQHLAQSGGGGASSREEEDGGSKPASTQAPAAANTPAAKPPLGSFDDHEFVRKQIKALTTDETKRLTDWWKQQDLPNIEKKDLLTAGQVESVLSFITLLHEQRVEAPKASSDADALAERARKMAEKKAAPKGGADRAAGDAA